MKNKKSHFSTRSVHTGRDPKNQFGFVNTPVYRGSTIVFETLADYKTAQENRSEIKSISYAATGNPGEFALEDVMTDLENGYMAITVSTGLAAITVALSAFLKQGDHLLVVDTVYHPTRVFCDTVLARYGIETEYFHPSIGADIKRLVKPNTACIFLESPGSCTFEICDTDAITQIAKSHNVISIMDNTWASPYFFRPLDHGINVSLCAATKYIIGHSDALLGIITCDKDSYYQVRDYRNAIGQYSSPDDIFLGLRGIRTLEVRMKQHHSNALAVANWLRAQEDVLQVFHPALEECPGHDIWRRDFEGASGLFSFEVKKRSHQALEVFLDNMKLFTLGASWGSYQSLLLPIDIQEQRTVSRCSDDRQLIRIHVGLESVDDLITDLEQGLQRYRSSD